MTILDAQTRLANARHGMTPAERDALDSIIARALELESENARWCERIKVLEARQDVIREALDSTPR